jgi:hypothetical protein
MKIKIICLVFGLYALKKGDRRQIMLLNPGNRQFFNPGNPGSDNFLFFRPGTKFSHGKRHKRQIILSLKLDKFYSKLDNLVKIE